MKQSDEMTALEVAFQALQDLSCFIPDLHEHIEHLETENQNLAEQILALEDELEGYRDGGY